MKSLNTNVFVLPFVNQTETETGVDTVDREQLEERRCEVERNMRCVGRAVRLMVFLSALAIVGLGYSTVLIPDWPQTLRQFFMYWPVKAHCALGFASLGCAFVFSSMGMLYRRELSWLDVTTASTRIVPLVPTNVIQGPFGTDPMKEVA